MTPSARRQPSTPPAYEEIAPTSARAKAIAMRYPLHRTPPVPQCADVVDDSLTRYLCTRAVGHPGPHVAHGIAGEVFAWWPQVADVH